MRGKKLGKKGTVLLAIGFIIFFFPLTSLAGDFDTHSLRHDADFKKEIRDDVFWVPLSILGKPELTRSELKELRDKPEELQESISNLYDAIHYLQISGLRPDYKFLNTSQFWVSWADGGSIWNHVAPAQYSLEEKIVSPAAMTNIINYLLQGNYEEIGFFWASPRLLGANTRPFFLNYIKHEGCYYIINPEPYILAGQVGVESGDISDYHIEENFAPLHQTEDLGSFLEYYLEIQSGIFSVATFTGKTAPPFTNYRKSLVSYLGIPQTFPRENYNPIYQERKEYRFVPPPWECPPEYKEFPEYTSYIPAARPPGEVRIKSGSFFTTIADQEQSGWGMFLTGSYQLFNQFSIKGRVMRKFGESGLTGLIGLLSYNPPGTGYLKASLDVGPGYFLGNIGEDFAELGWEFGLDTGINLRPGIDIGFHGKYRLLRFEQAGQPVDFSGWDLGGSIIIRF